jgi:SAM-dependent methyltransferase
VTTSFSSTRRFPAGRAGIRDGLGLSEGSKQVGQDGLSAIAASVRRQAAYSTDAESYAARTRLLHHWRLRIAELLDVDQGAVVIDVGCGSGLCFDVLQQRVGPDGTIVGIDAAPEMLDLARRLVAERSWGNVVLVEAPVEEAIIPAAADGVLFSAVHDVLQSPAALRNIFAHTRSGARVAAGGGKWAPPWAVGLNAMTAAAHAPFVRDFTGFDRPWRLLHEHVPDLRVHEIELGSGYLASGTTLSA